MNRTAVDVGRKINRTVHALDRDKGTRPVTVPGGFDEQTGDMAQLEQKRRLLRGEGGVEKPQLRHPAPGVKTEVQREGAPSQAQRLVVVDHQHPAVTVTPDAQVVEVKERAQHAPGVRGNQSPAEAAREEKWGHARKLAGPTLRREGLDSELMIERIAIVTGATGGMGREIVADLARDHHVYALGRNDESLAELGALEGVTPVNADLVEDLLNRESDSSAVTRLTELTRVDVLIHAAAIARRRSVETARTADWRDQHDLNVVVPAELTRRLLPALRRAAGTVVFLNSGAGRGGYPENIVYAATKHALHALADGLRKGEAPNGVRVATVAPGPTDTGMLRDLHAEAGQEYIPEHYIAPVEVARAIRLVVDTGESTQIAEVAVRPRIELGDRR